MQPVRKTLFRQSICLLSWGLSSHPTKSVLVPTQEVGFLGFLLNSVSMKIEQDQATGVLVVSIWQTQPWFTTLLHLLVDYPLRLPKSNQLLMQPHNSALHPLRKQLKLMVCKLSGTSLQHKHVSDKAAEIILKSWSAGTQKQYKPYITQWIDFCSKRESDPYDPPLTAVLDFLNLYNMVMTFCSIFYHC